MHLRIECNLFDPIVKFFGLPHDMAAVQPSVILMQFQKLKKRYRLADIFDRLAGLDLSEMCLPTCATQPIQPIFLS
jgi:hypothetical protein